MCSVLFSPTKRGSTIIEVVRATYEAILILSFFNLIVAYVCFEDGKGIRKNKMQECLLQMRELRWPVIDWVFPCWRWQIKTKKTATRVFNTLKFLCLQNMFINFTFSGETIVLVAVTYVGGDSSKIPLIKVNILFKIFFNFLVFFKLN